MRVLTSVAARKELREHVHFHVCTRSSALQSETASSSNLRNNRLYGGKLLILAENTEDTFRLSLIKNFLPVTATYIYIHIYMYTYIKLLNQILVITGSHISANGHVPHVQFDQ